jgi:hypothetical protein
MPRGNISWSLQSMAWTRKSREEAEEDSETNMLTRKDNKALRRRLG